MSRLWMLIGVCLLTACSSVPEGMARLHLNGPGRTERVDVELAVTPQEQEQGLMGRTSLGENQGMLFVFPDERTRYFWMKNTLIPLDILYFAADGSLVSTVTMEPCAADPCQVYPSAGPAQYALEVSEGFVAEHQIESDWRLSIDAIKKAQGVRR